MNKPLDPALQAGNQKPLAGYQAQHFLWEVKDGVGTITLNRPERKNPLTFDSYAELRDWFLALQRATDIKAVVLTGAGGNFCSGGDVHEIIGPLIRLTAPGNELLMQSPSLALHVGGAEANVAIGLAHLGQGHAGAGQIGAEVDEGGDVIRCRLRGGGDGGLAKQRRALADGRPGLCEDGACLVGLALERLVEIRVQFHLIDARRYARGGNDAVEMLGQEVGDADGRHLAAVDQGVQAGAGGIGIHQRIGAVQQQHIQPLDLQALQRALHRGADVRRRGVVVLHPPATRRVRRLDAALADQLDVVAPRRVGLQPAAEQRLAAETAVQVGVVEAGDA